MTDQPFEKRIDLAHDYLNEGESRVVPLAVSYGQLTVDDRASRGHVKTAAAEEALAACANVKPQADRVYALVIGLGSSEFWGVNNNGDSFPENALLGLPPVDSPMAFFDKYKARIRPGWGYKTFLKGHVFEEHRNSNPRFAIGGIQDTFWNNRMHRVENLIWIDRKKGKKWAERLDAGKTIGTSMACKVPFDRCSLCSNLAPTRAQYCPHLKPGTSAYQLRQIRDDGLAVSMINDFPHFFDESCVENPAAPEALSIMKVASDAAKVAARKQAELKKTGPDLPLDVMLDDVKQLYQSEPHLPASVIDKLRQFPLTDVTAGLKKLGMALRPSEMFALCYGADALPTKVARDLDDQVWVAPVRDGYDPRLAEAAQVKIASLPDPRATQRVVDLLTPFATKRSYLEPYLTPRLMQTPVKAAHAIVARPDLQPYLDAYHGLYKRASGEFGYGATQLYATYQGLHGAW
jgi:hypothetical protein